jgi:CSLREA domain-containing protein
MRASHLFLLLSLAAGPSVAADFVVTRTDDPVPDAVTPLNCRAGGDCSLREAVLAANKRSGPDRILLGRGVHELTRATTSTTPDGLSGPLRVTDALEVVGEGTGLTRVRWRAGTTPPHSFLPHKHALWWAEGEFGLTLRQLTLSDGRGNEGGCILRRYGDLVLQDAVVERCIGVLGGAINFHGLYMTDSSLWPVLSLRNTVLRQNQADYGGALFLRQTATVIGDGAQLLANTALVQGGAVNATLSESTLMSYALQLVWRSEGAGTLVADNTSAGDGGGFALSGPGYANLFSTAGAQPLRIERNLAAGAGGGISMQRRKVASPLVGTSAGLTLEISRLTDNAAASGGGLSLRGVRAVVRAVSFERNQATTGAGGAVSTDYAPESSDQNLLSIGGSTFNQNSAATRGGALFNQCQVLSASDSSFSANSSVGQGEVVSSTGNTTLIHVTTDGHGQPTQGPSSLHQSFHTACTAPSFQVANSIIGGTDNCYAQYGTISSAGGNQFSNYAGGCWFLAGQDAYGTAATFGLSLGTFGGSLNVLGWNSDGASRPQVDFGRSPYCTPTDIRGLPRSDGACDAGAFEQQ